MELMKNSEVKENIVLTNEQLNYPNFIAALRTLNSCELPVKTAYVIGCVCGEVDKLITANRELFSKMVKKYAKLDDKGNVEPEKDDKGNPVYGTFLFKEDVNKEEFEKEVKDFSEIKHEIPKLKLNINSLGSVALSGRDISALEPLLCGLED